MTAAKTWGRIQAEQAEWSTRNFGTDRKPYWPYLGMVEELGELTHAQLKGEQGIRHSPEEIEAKKKDALGDIAIYALDFCTLNGLEAEAIFNATCLEESLLYIMDDDLHQLLARAVHGLGTLGNICVRTQTGGKLPDDVVVRTASFDLGVVLSSCEAYARNHGWLLTEILEEVWAQVSQRDWQACSKTGNA